VPLKQATLRDIKRHLATFLVERLDSRNTKQQKARHEDAL
jgi:hypothetical protein